MTEPEVDPRHFADVVFEGGGVKGIAHLGALSVMEKSWQWQNVGGTSAGAIVAAFVACGKSAEEIKEILDSFDLKELMDKGWEDRVGDAISLGGAVDRIPVIGRFLGPFLRYAPSILTQWGIYEGDRFVELVNMNLPDGIRTFGDLLYDPDAPKSSPHRYRLRVVASDITAKRMLILPQDIAYLGLDPDELRIADALRMSMSIPIFFEPYKITDSKGLVHHIVDGGILSNYPIWMFDSPPGEDPEWPTFGLNLYSPGGGEMEPYPSQITEIKSFVDFAKNLTDTATSAMDRRFIKKKHWAQTVKIDDKGISGTSFDLGDADKQKLWDTGVAAAEEFMNEWGAPDEGFAAWKSVWIK